MEEKELAYYLEDLHRIHDLSLEKLGEWKEKYPYSQAVHFLMAKKHQVEGFVDDMSVYHKASFYAVDRDFLQLRMTQSELEAPIVELEKEVTIPTEEQTENESEHQQAEEVTEQISAIENTKEPIDISIHSPDVNNAELSEFAQWVTSLGGFSNSTENIGLPKKKKKKKKKSKLERTIENSVIKREEIVTEPLANILAQQGHTEKAIEMYRKLSLIFPEKSSFFALQIEKLINSK